MASNPLKNDNTKTPYLCYYKPTNSGQHQKGVFNLKKILSKLKNKKGATLIELILIIGALSLITVFGLNMFKHQANKTGGNFQDNIIASDTQIQNATGTADISGTFATRP